MTGLRPLVLLAFGSSLLLSSSAPAHAAVAAPANDDCLACHDDPAAKRANGTSIVVSAAQFGGSVHGQLSMNCVDCHADLATTTEFPHPEKLAPVACATCHQEQVDKYATSVHGQLRASGQNGKAATCVSCHGTHNIRPSKDPESQTYALNLPKTCGQCHGNNSVIRGEMGRIFNEYEDSVHGRAVSKSGLLVAANCTSCHGSHEIARHADAASHVSRPNVPGTCAKCHEGVATVFAKGVHGQQLQKGNTAAPVCSDCHTSHQIQRVDVENWKLDVIRECGNCHQDKIQTYRDTFHGKITELGFTRVAACADCHSNHAILPASDPTSMVSKARRLQTCQKCHPAATANFAAYDPHADPHNVQRNPMLFYTAEFMKTLLGGVFIFFGVHTLLWFPRSVKQRREKNSPELRHE